MSKLPKPKFAVFLFQINVQEKNSNVQTHLCNVTVEINNEMEKKLSEEMIKIAEEINKKYGVNTAQIVFLVQTRTY